MLMWSVLRGAPKISASPVSSTDDASEIQVGIFVYSPDGVTS
jgi:hypothetical protein